MRASEASGWPGSASAFRARWTSRRDRCRPRTAAGRRAGRPAAGRDPPRAERSPGVRRQRRQRPRAVRLDVRSRQRARRRSSRWRSAPASAAASSSTARSCGAGSTPRARSDTWPVSLDGPRCSCGNVGCLNVYAARPAHGGARPEAARAISGLHLAWPDRRRSWPPERRPAVRGRRGAVIPSRAPSSTRRARRWPSAIGALVNLLNPDVIVITGGVAVSLAPLAEDIRRRARRRALATVLDATAVHVVPGDKRRTVRGGAALVLYELTRRDGDGLSPSPPRNPSHVRAPAGRADLLPGDGRRDARPLPPATVPGRDVQPHVEAPESRISRATSG